MTQVKDVERLLFDWAPAELAADWDNVGLLVGDPDREVRKILTTLDITESVVEEAIHLGADLIVSHHPGIPCSPSAAILDRAAFSPNWRKTVYLPFVCTPIWMLLRAVSTTCWRKNWAF